MKTKEELNALKEEIGSLNKKLAELTGEELEQVTGRTAFSDPDIIDVPKHGLYCPICSFYIGEALMDGLFICPACHNQIIPEPR